MTGSWRTGPPGRIHARGGRRLGQVLGEGAESGEPRSESRSGSGKGGAAVRAGSSRHPGPHVGAPGGPQRVAGARGLHAGRQPGAEGRSRWREVETDRNTHPGGWLSRGPLQRDSSKASVSVSESVCASVTCPAGGTRERAVAGVSSALARRCSAGWSRSAAGPGGDARCCPGRTLPRGAVASCRVGACLAAQPLPHPQRLGSGSPQFSYAPSTPPGGGPPPG